MKNRNFYLIKLISTLILTAICLCLVSCGTNGNTEDLAMGITKIKNLTAKNAGEETGAPEIDPSETESYEIDTMEDLTEIDSTEEDITYIYGANIDEYCEFTGRIVKTDHGYFFVDGERHAPLLGRIDFVKMIPDAEDVSLDALKTGDRVKIYIMCVMESYPPQTFVPKLVLIEEGTPESVPTDIINTLEELGYEIQ